MRVCECVSKFGPKKVYHSRQRAVNSAIRQGLKRFRTYPCPTLKGKWHITTNRRK